MQMILPFLSHPEKSKAMEKVTKKRATVFEPT